MTHTAGMDQSDLVCIPDEGTLPDGPFTALRYHFGMLLGVDDFATEQRYHRGKTRLHNAWLHRAGIVWGLDVDVVQDTREVRVFPGLALDPSGRELHLDVRCCMDIGAWYDEHSADANAKELEDGSVQFDGRVELAFCSCGTRAVPAIAGPCEGADVDTAYSRTYETVSIRFVPEILDPPAAAYPRLRLLFGLADGVPDDLPDKAEVLAARDDVLAQAAADQPGALLGYFREFADRDTVALGPDVGSDGVSTAPYPFGNDAGVVLANLRGVTLAGAEGSRTLTAFTLERAPRRAHVATATIEELLCGRILGGAGGGGAAGPDAGGPRVTDIAVDRAGKSVTIKLDRPLDESSVGHDAFRVARLQNAGWEPIKVRSATLAGDGLSVVVALRTDPGTDPLRFIAHGTGQTPLVGKDLVPLAGAAGGPPGSKDDGNDYVHMAT